MSEELKPCQHGRNFCMECHYDSKSPQQRLDDANATIARLRAELDGERNMAARHQRTIGRLKRELDALRGQSEWIACAERLPEAKKDGRLVMAFVCGVVTTKATATVRELAQFAKEDGEQCAVTHWRPLPAAPSRQDA